MKKAPSDVYMMEFTKEELLALIRGLGWMEREGADTRFTRRLQKSLKRRLHKLAGHLLDRPSTGIDCEGNRYWYGWCNLCQKLIGKNGKVSR